MLEFFELEPLQPIISNHITGANPVAFVHAFSSPAHDGLNILLRDCKELHPNQNSILQIDEIAFIGSEKQETITASLSRKGEIGDYTPMCGRHSELELDIPEVDTASSPPQKLLEPFKPPLVHFTQEEIRRNILQDLTEVAVVNTDRTDAERIGSTGESMARWTTHKPQSSQVRAMLLDLPLPAYQKHSDHYTVNILTNSFVSLSIYAHTTFDDRMMDWNVLDSLAPSAQQARLTFFKEKPKLHSIESSEHPLLTFQGENTPLPKHEITKNGHDFDDCVIATLSPLSAWPSARMTSDMLQPETKSTTEHFLDLKQTAALPSGLEAFLQIKKIHPSSHDTYTTSYSPQQLMHATSNRALEVMKHHQSAAVKPNDSTELIPSDLSKAHSTTYSGISTSLFTPQVDVSRFSKTTSGPSTSNISCPQTTKYRLAGNDTAIQNQQPESQIVPIWFLASQLFLEDITTILELEER